MDDGGGEGGASKGDLYDIESEEEDDEPGESTRCIELPPFALEPPFLRGAACAAEAAVKSPASKTKPMRLEAFTIDNC